MKAYMLACLDRNLLIDLNDWIKESLNIIVFEEIILKDVINLII